MTMTVQPVRTGLAVPVEPTDHTLGPDHAPVTVVEYGDFECPTCKMAAPGVKLLLDRYPNCVRLVFRHFPLEEAHPHALQAAEASESAAAQGRFWEMHDLLFANQTHLKRRELERYAAQLALDTVRFSAEMNAHYYLQRVREHIDGARRMHVRATPTFYVNGVVAGHLVRHAVPARRRGRRRRDRLRLTPATLRRSCAQSGITWNGRSTTKAMTVPAGTSISLPVLRAAMAPAAPPRMPPITVPLSSSIW